MEKEGHAVELNNLPGDPPQNDALWWPSLFSLSELPLSSPSPVQPEPSLSDPTGSSSSLSSVCRVSMAPRLPAMLARASVCALLWASSLISVYAIRPDSGSLALSRALSGALSSVYPTSTSRGSEVSAPLREGRVLLGEADHSYKVHEAVPLYANKGV